MDSSHSWSTKHSSGQIYRLVVASSIYTLHPPQWPGEPPPHRAYIYSAYIFTPGLWQLIVYATVAAQGHHSLSVFPSPVCQKGQELHTDGWVMRCWITAPKHFECTVRSQQNASSTKTFCKLFLTFLTVGFGINQPWIYQCSLPLTFPVCNFSLLVLSVRQ